MTNVNKMLTKSIVNFCSAILYLNDDFDGGEFVFARNKTDIQVCAYLFYHVFRSALFLTLQQLEHCITGLYSSVLTIIA